MHSCCCSVCLHVYIALRKPEMKAGIQIQKFCKPLGRYMLCTYYGITVKQYLQAAVVAGACLPGLVRSGSLSHSQGQAFQLLCPAPSQTVHLACHVHVNQLAPPFHLTGALTFRRSSNRFVVHPGSCLTCQIRTPDLFLRMYCIGAGHPVTAPRVLTECGCTACKASWSSACLMTLLLLRCLPCTMPCRRCEPSESLGTQRRTLPQKFCKYPCCSTHDLPCTVLLCCLAGCLSWLSPCWVLRDAGYRILVIKYPCCATCLAVEMFTQ
jgi:hypothetical protein